MVRKIANFDLLPSAFWKNGNNPSVIKIKGNWKLYAHYFHI